MICEGGARCSPNLSFSCGSKHYTETNTAQIHSRFFALSFQFFGTVHRPKDLEVDITRDADGGSTDAGSIDWHVNIGGPVGILPFKIQAVVGLEVGGQGAVVRKLAFPFNRQVPVAGNSRGNAVIRIDLLRDGDFLAVGGRGQLDVGIILAVCDDDVLSIILKVKAGSDGDTSTVGVESLGGFDGADIKATTSAGDHVDVQVGGGVVGIDLNVSVGEVIGHFCAGRDSPSRDLSTCLSPDAAGEGGNVGGWASSSLNSVGKIQIPSTGRGLPGNGGVQTIKSIEAAIADRDLQQNRNKGKNWKNPKSLHKGSAKKTTSRQRVRSCLMICSSKRTESWGLLAETAPMRARKAMVNFIFGLVFRNY